MFLMVSCTCSNMKDVVTGNPTVERTAKCEVECRDKGGLATVGDGENPECYCIGLQKDKK